MWNKKLILSASLCTLLLLSTSAANANVVLITNLNDLRANIPPLDWGQLGPPFTQVPQQFQSDIGGVFLVDGTFAGGPGERLDEGTGWVGNFTLGDHLLWTNANGPLVLDFGRVQGVGLQIETNSYGPFTAQIKAFNGNTLLGTFLENGNSQPTEDGSAIFIGVKDSIIDITSIELSIVSCTGNCADFAINSVYFRAFNIEGVPEPASIVLLGSGLLAAVGSSLRKHTKKL